METKGEVDIDSKEQGLLQTTELYKVGVFS